MIMKFWIYNQEAGNVGAKPKGKVGAGILAAIKERRSQIEQIPCEAHPRWVI